VKAHVLLVALLASLISASVHADEPKPKYGPRGAPYAVTLAQSHDYFRKAAAPDYWAMAGYYVPQFNGYACSVASVTMVLNAARAGIAKTSDDKLILQQALLDAVNVENWKDRLSDGGHNGKHGMHNLEQLAAVTEASFRTHGFPKAVVTVVRVKDGSAKSRAMVRKALVANERSAHDFIIANFNQQKFTDDSDAGHIAPVAAFDATRDRVLMFDPDRDWYEPYWISLDTFVAGMATLDSGAGANRGFVLVRVE
jgi:hypothetical protein